MSHQNFHTVVAHDTQQHDEMRTEYGTATAHMRTGTPARTAPRFLCAINREQPTGPHEQISVAACPETPATIPYPQDKVREKLSPYLAN